MLLSNENLQVVEILTESLTILKTPVLTKIARLFLVSDILHNIHGISLIGIFFFKFFVRSFSWIPFPYSIRRNSTFDIY